MPCGNVQVRLSFYVTQTPLFPHFFVTHIHTRPCYFNILPDPYILIETIDESDVSFFWNNFFDFPPLYPNLFFSPPRFRQNLYVLRKREYTRKVWCNASWNFNFIFASLEFYFARTDDMFNAFFASHKIIGSLNPTSTLRRETLEWQPLEDK